MFHLTAYGASTAAVTDTGLNAPDDQVMTSRNSHLILTEEYRLLQAYAGGLLLTRARFANPQSIVRTQPHIWPINVGDTPLSLTQPMDFRDLMPALAQNEEITINVSTSGAGPSRVNVGLWYAPPNWNQNIPQGEGPFVVRATCVITAGTAATWTNLASLTLERDLYNGVYSVIGAYVVDANGVFFRLRFPTSPVVSGKALRPGGIVQNTNATFPVQYQGNGGFGEWGRFHTFETLQMQCFDDAVGGTYEVRLVVKYLGGDKSLLLAA